MFIYNYPINYVLTGDMIAVEAVLKKKPAGLNWYRRNVLLKSDPRVTVTFDQDTLRATLTVKKSKMADEAKYKCQVEKKDSSVEEFAGFSVFVKGNKNNNC